MDGSNLEGSNVSITVTGDVDGGIFYPVIPGQFLATYEETTQVNKFENPIQKHSFIEDNASLKCNFLIPTQVVSKIFKIH